VASEVRVTVWRIQRLVWAASRNDAAQTVMIGAMAEVFSQVSVEVEARICENWGEK
jgi:hypothetical protein